ncbi:hypothetical protein Kpol_1061p14 [Vanderwaltozyma polyspora DSM 70294]|uniref:Glycoside hydrolase family 5 domain-containing protein n=1 Tax=Vanderwaltozyma polyspora (strain ATCC 22028 / DSM 70294 / BCRC 21397 / CBS 2163 / NBRC 10782 / NRRL Y-8283 / UCD 57-17) TaxID=436907 RepID=A7TJE1_VANPO|nr:uncharacterized protein Kpol_1061p14 [Vanderwaltozyma polyspora DSM 70294]EDO17591.1 hypothetical protein Kpol_1061p14 [Vanderwaltozyma polyspora DSM 70294]
MTIGNIKKLFKSNSQSEPEPEPEQLPPHMSVQNQRALNQVVFSVTEDDSTLLEVTDPAASTTPAFNTIPNVKDIFRWRYNYGVNLGSCFLLESWIYSDLFEKGGASELDAINRNLTAFGVDVTAQKLSSHYTNYISTLDWNWLKNNANITALRVPIGYWHVNNGQFVDGTPFAPLKSVYQKAAPWDKLKNLIYVAKQYGIGILVDVHGLPGGANSSDASGSINNPPTFFKNPTYISKMVNQILPFIARDVCINNINVIGLQIVNEADTNNTPVNEHNYYLRSAKAIGAIDPQLPVVISDGWWPEQQGTWVQQNNLVSTVVVDAHIYRCFSSSDKSKTAQQIISSLNSTVNYPSKSADFLTGEFSCVLDEQTWNRTSGNRADLIKQFGQTQVAIFSQVSSWGWFFWTLKFQIGNGGEWGFVPQVSKNNIPRRPQGSGITIDWGKVQRIYQDHINYWKGKGSYFEHWRFADAIYKAASDVQTFSQYGNSRIGRTLSWTKLRRGQYIALKGDSSYMWEWDQGYQKGLDEFNKY